MEKTLITTGKTIELAIEAALTQLGLERDDVSVQVLAQAKAGFLGFGATPAKIQVTYEAPDPAPEAPKVALSSASRSKPKAQKPQAPKAEAPKAEAPKAEPKKAEPKAEAPKAEPKKAESKPKAEKQPKPVKEEAPKAPKESKTYAPAEAHRTICHHGFRCAQCICHKFFQTGTIHGNHIRFLDLLHVVDRQRIVMQTTGTARIQPLYHDSIHIFCHRIGKQVNRICGGNHSQPRRLFRLFFLSSAAGQQQSHH